MSEQKMTEPEDLNIRAILSVAVVALTLFVIAAFWANWILDSNVKEILPEGPPVTPSTKKAEVGIVNQHLFDLDDRATVTRETQLHRLRTYGWVDRDAGVVHIPVEQAMEAVVREAAP